MQGERGWLGRDVVLVDRDVLREGPDPQVAGASVDLVAYLEVAYGRADPGHRAGAVVPEHERGPVLQEALELAVADHLVQRVDAGGAHLDQHVAVADLGLGYVGDAESVPAVVLDDECLHELAPGGSLPAARRSWTDASGAYPLARARPRVASAAGQGGRSRHDKGPGSGCGDRRGDGGRAGRAG